MELDQITDETALRAALGAGRFLLFKHSMICPVSAAAFNEYRHYLAEGDAPPTAWLDVRGHRPLSQAIAAETGVAHESPQALLVRDGKVVWHASHGGITRASLRTAVEVDAA